MREMMSKYGLVKRLHGDAGLAAATTVRKSQQDYGMGFMWQPSAGKQQYQRRRLRRSRKDLLCYSESPLPSRAIRVIRNAIQGLEWGLQPRNVQEASKKKEAYQKATEAAKKIISKPNSTDDDLPSFLGPVIEDILIFDAGCWEYVDKPKNVANNDVLALEVVPGLTIALNRKWSGDPKMPRWVQLKDDGQIGVTFLDTELEYIMMRKRSFDPFGVSPLETALEVMDTLTNLNSYQRQIASEAYPSMLIYLGDEIDDTQRRIFHNYWVSELQGRGTPGFVGGFGTRLRPEPIPLKPNGDEGLFLEYQDFQTRVLSVCFDLHPMDFGLQADVNRSTAEVTMSATLREAIKPYAQVLKTKYNVHVLPRIAENTGTKEIGELEFWWVNLDPKDEQRQSQIDNVYATQDAITIDEMRSNINLDPLPNNLGKLTVTAFRNLLGMDPLILLRDEESIKKLLNPPDDFANEGDMSGWGGETGGTNGGPPEAMGGEQGGEETGEGESIGEPQ